MSEVAENVSTGSDAGTEGKSTEQPKGKKSSVQFSSEQQEILEALIDRSYGKGFEKANTEATTKLTTVEKQLADALKRIESFEKTMTGGKTVEASTQVQGAAETKPEPKTKKTDPDVEKLAAQLEELRKAQDEIKRSRDEALEQVRKQKDSEKKTRLKEWFLDETRPLNFIDQMQVFRLVEDQLAYDEEANQFVVMNQKTGRPRMDATLENPLPLKDFMAQWASDNKHHIRAADSTGGTGAAESRRVNTQLPGPKAIEDMSNEEFEAYRQKVLAKQFQR